MDLDLPPKHRWTNIVLARKDAVSDEIDNFFFQFFKRLVQRICWFPSQSVTLMSFNASSLPLNSDIRLCVRHPWIFFRWYVFFCIWVSAENLSQGISLLILVGKYFLCWKMTKCQMRKALNIELYYLDIEIYQLSEARHTIHNHFSCLQNTGEFSITLHTYFISWTLVWNMLLVT